jgi:hypothetical protein
LNQQNNHKKEFTMNLLEKDSAQVSPTDIGSVDAILAALYEAISFPPNGEPEWNRVRSLFLPGGRMIPPRMEEQGDYPVMDVESFIVWGNQLADVAGLRTTGFYEKQVAHRIEKFGNIVHVFSTYESRFTENDPEPFERGINSIQLVWDQGRWWTVTIFWDIERDGNPIPAKYLPRRSKM